MSIEALTLKCPTCGRTQKYARNIDPKIPARVATIELRCEKCNDGDFDAEVWRDKRGHLVNQAVAWPSARRGRHDR